MSRREAGKVLVLKMLNVNFFSRNKYCCALANAGKILFQNFQRRGAFIMALHMDKWKMTIKKVHRPIGNRFRICSVRPCQFLYNVKQKGQLKLCAPLEIRVLIANYCGRWRRIFKGLSQDGGPADFSKNLRNLLFDKYLLNEPNFG